jgi:hypothetical protein
LTVEKCKKNALITLIIETPEKASLILFFTIKDIFSTIKLKSKNFIFPDVVGIVEG